MAWSPRVSPKDRNQRKTGGIDGPLAATSYLEGEAEGEGRVDGDQRLHVLEPREHVRLVAAV